MATSNQVETAVFKIDSEYGPFYVKAHSYVEARREARHLASEAEWADFWEDYLNH